MNEYKYTTRSDSKSITCSHRDCQKYVDLETSKYLTPNKRQRIPKWQINNGKSRQTGNINVREYRSGKSTMETQDKLAT